MKLHRPVFALSTAVLLLGLGCGITTGLSVGEAPEEPVQQPSVRLLPTENPTVPPPIDRRARLMAYDRDGISVYDPESGERSELLISPLWLPEIDLTAISSSGLIAARTVSQENVPIDLALTIMSVPEGRLIKHIPLFSQELQEHIEEGRYSMEWLFEDVSLALVDRWFKPHWSPDGQSVAFAAAIDGPSADVYLYDVERDELQRLTQEHDQAVVLGMSPDGEWVVYVEGFGFEYNYYEVPDRERIGYFSGPVHAVSTATGRVVDLYQSDSARRISLVGWYSPTEFAFTEVEMDLGMFYLYKVDVINRHPVLLYGGGFEGISLDPESGVAAFTVPEQGMTSYGLHLVEATYESLVTLDRPETGGYAGPIPWYPEVESFFTEAESGIASIPSSGSEVRIYEDEYCLPRASSDGLLLAFWGCGYAPGLSLYYESGEWIKDYEVGFVQAVVWGSHTMYVLEGAEDSLQLLKLATSNSEIELMDPNARQTIASVVPQPVQQTSVRLLPTEISKATPRPVATTPPISRPVPVATLESAVRESGPLNATGPWITVITDGSVVAANPDGTGATVLFSEIPKPNLMNWREQSMWLAQASKSGWVAIRVVGEEEFDPIPRLLITRLPATEALYEIPILTPELAARMNDADDYWEGSFGASEVFLAIDSDSWSEVLSWSPDGKLLAFAAAIDGPSADLYVFDTERAEIRRLSHSPTAPAFLGWSPDSRWVLHQEIESVGFDDPYLFSARGLWATAADGSGSKSISSPDAMAFLIGWLSPTQPAVTYFDLNSGYNGPLQLLDLEDGTATTIGDGEVFWEWIDAVPGMVLFYSEETADNWPLTALMLVDGNPRLLNLDELFLNNNLGYINGWNWSTALEAMLLQTDADIVVALTRNGEFLFVIQDECGLPSVSPDGRWLTFDLCDYGERGGIRVHDMLDGSVRQITEQDTYLRDWFPDSSGFYYFLDRDSGPKQLVFATVLDGISHTLPLEITYSFFDFQIVGGQE